ncbi:MAG: carbohydrate kinase [Halobacteria archaeon]
MAINPEALCVGELLVDLVATRPGPDPPGFAKFAGGAPANVAVGLARLGARVAFAGRVSEDRLGSFLIATLEREGVETRWLRRSREPTGLAFVYLGRGGERTFDFHRTGSADMALGPEDLPAFGRGLRLLHCGSGPLLAPRGPAALRRAVARAGRLGVPVSFDPNMRRDHPFPRPFLRWLLARTDLLLLTEEEARIVTGARAPDRAARALLRRFGPEWLALKRGARGSLLFHEGERISPPAFRVRAADTTGAGDGFAAALLFGLLRGWPAGKMGRFANAAGALVCTRPGAMTALPTLARLERFAGRQA